MSTVAYIGNRHPRSVRCKRAKLLVMAIAQATRTHCPKGHPYDAANTCLSGGRRHCLACGRARRAAKAPPKPTLIEKLMAKVSVVPSGCWIWTGAKQSGGYGTYAGKLAHRLVYEVLVGPIPRGLLLDHECHNSSGCSGGPSCPHRLCVNPEHLNPTTLVENVMNGQGFGAVNSRKTECPAGHPYSPDNTWVSVAGHRQCRTCNREARRLAQGGDAQ